MAVCICHSPSADITVQRLASETNGVGLMLVVLTVPCGLCSRMLWGKLGMGTQYHTIITSPNGKDLQEIAQLVSEGKLKAIVAKTFLLGEAV